MKIWRMFVGLPIALLGSQAVAENWVKVTEDPDYAGFVVDKDSIRRGSDGLVYFTEDAAGKADNAADCKRRILYTLKLEDMVDGTIDYPKWRDNGRAAVPNSIGGALLDYACANAG